MNQSERRRYLIQELIKENTQYNNLEIPQNKEEQKQLLRSLMNIRFACPISDEFKQIQDEYLTEENKNRGIIQLKDLSEIKKDQERYLPLARRHHKTQSLSNRKCSQ